MSSNPPRPWWTISTRSWYARWQRATWKRWGTTIPARWSSAALVLALAALAPAQTLEKIAHAFAEKPEARRAALVRFAAAHPADREGALALFAAALVDRSQGRAADALRLLKQAQPRLSPIEDYVGYHIAAAQFDLGNFAAVSGDLSAVWAAQPRSPLEADAAMLAARAYKELGQPDEAVRVLRAWYDGLPQPAGDLLLAGAYRAATGLASAVNYYQRVYYGYPAAPEASQADAALRDMRASMGDLFAPAPARLQIQRAERLAEAGDYRRARAEYQSVAERLSGADRDLARVRIGVMDYRLYSTQGAYNYLRELDVSGEADAERLDILLECARRLDREDLIGGTIQALERAHPQSPWRMRALISAGNHYLVDNRPDRYVPLYRACADSFVSEPRSSYCHWKVAWYAYINRQPQARDLLREHLVRYPGTGRSSTALYFLGRLAEAAGEYAAAKQYYTEIATRYPNHFYAGQAEHRLAQPAVSGAAASAAVGDYLKGIVWPITTRHADFTGTPAARARLARARLIDSAGLEDLAERELRYAARVDKQPHLAAMQLAQEATRYDSPFRALRLMKSLVPDYLSVPYEDAPAAFWRLLYPLPYRPALERYARERGLDPFLVAGLIRQESEFNPNALSAANAYGLTQVMPSTGRQLLKQSRRRFRPKVLFQPELNLRLGTTYLRRVIDSYSGRAELALAAYNAGPMRVQNWITWADYKEPAEFIETIPFTETREYVLAVLRNAEMYRRLYEDEPVTAASAKLRDVGKIAPKKPVRKPHKAKPGRKARRRR